MSTGSNRGDQASPNKHITAFTTLDFEKTPSTHDPPLRFRTALHLMSTTLSPAEGDAPVCLGCHQPILDGSVVAFGDAIFHIDCFRCARCKIPVDAASSLLLLTDGHPLCTSCSDSCRVCNKPIGDEAVITGPDEAYHADCFRCVRCGARIEDLVYAKTSNGICCMPCHHERQERRKTRKMMMMQQQQKGPENGKGGSSTLMVPGEAPVSARDFPAPPANTHHVDAKVLMEISTPGGSTTQLPVGGNNAALQDATSSSILALMEQLELERDQVVSRLERTEQDFARLKSINIKLANELATVNSERDEQIKAREKAEAQVEKQKEEYQKLLETYEMMASAQAKLASLPPEKEQALQTSVIKLQASNAELKSELKAKVGEVEELRKRVSQLEKSLVDKDVLMRKMDMELSRYKSQSPISAYSEAFHATSPAHHQATLPVRTLADELGQSGMIPNGLESDPKPSLPALPSAVAALRKKEALSQNKHDSFYSEAASPPQEVSVLEKSTAMESNEVGPRTAGVSPPTSHGSQSSGKPPLTMNAPMSRAQVQSPPNSIRQTRSPNMGPTPVRSPPSSTNSQKSPPPEDVLARAEKRSSRHVQKFNWNDEVGSISSQTTTVTASSGPPVSKSSVASGGRAHRFAANTYLVRPGKCLICPDKLRGQELRCVACGVGIHNRCAKEAPLGCIPSKPVKPPSMFGNDLSQQLLLEGRSVPLIIQRCAEAVEYRGLELEGIYRKTGPNSQLLELVQRLDQLSPSGEGWPDLLRDKNIDITSVTSLLKKYLRELPEPLIPHGFYAKFVAVAEIPTILERSRALQCIVRELPLSHRDALHYIMQHFHRVQQYTSMNLMTSKNIAVVFAPTVMRCVDADQDFFDMPAKNAILSHCIDHVATIFGE